MNQKILITGGSGLLGLNWAMAVRDRYDVMLGLHRHQIALNGVSAQVLDLASVDQLYSALSTLNPDVIIHAAGLTSVEQCESDPALAHHINTGLAEIVGKVSAALGIKLVHISTDHLFRGDKSLMTETSAVSPVNMYGRSKLEAEEKVLGVYPDTLVVRTNFFGWGTTYRQSFSDMVISGLRNQNELTLFHDVHYTPILAESLVFAVHDLVDQGASGIINIVGDERVSKYEFGLILAERFGLDAMLIKPGLITDQPNLVQRPKDMSLSNRKACALLGRKLGSVYEHIDRLWHQEATGLIQEIQNL